DARAGKGETYGGIDYYGHTKKEFEQRAKRLGITGYSRMRKAELVKKIEQRERSESARQRGRKAA
ncbi:MAG TPA: Rho termination factor N-terminal domain-containing protein, partial [Thermoleophilia bacterium]|nr:Rho termination factor N-terminal domain-containing protein [Thermoleophilia bacterium]